jgi:curli production assembly/transport component CsgG
MFLTGCQTMAPPEGLAYESRVMTSALQEKFENIPELDGPVITVGIYNFIDKTGQRKPNTNFSSLSSAVTQGAEVWVIQALQEVGNGSWFKVVERIGLDNLIKERQLIRSTREQFEDEKGKQLKPLLFAGILIEGGVVGYDSNIATGGVGARYLGIGLQTEYRVDNVTISMRVVSVSTGEVLATISTEKTILSTSEGGSVFKFLDVGTRALEVEAGSTNNEPVNYAVRSAIEQAVVEIILLGEEKSLWKFKQ